MALVGALAVVLVVRRVDAPSPGLSDYDRVVLSDHPVAYWPLSPVASSAGGPGRDVTNHGHDGSLHGSDRWASTDLPNGDEALEFAGSPQVMRVPSSAAFSISTTKALTWEVWIKPGTAQFRRSTGGYVDFVGKCATYAPSCEWEGRLYDRVNEQQRPSRLSAYAFNPQAGLGSGADWQPDPGVVLAHTWIHVVAQYQLVFTPTECSPDYPGTIEIWVDGVPQNFGIHRPTGCMSQFRVRPRAAESPLTVGTVAGDSWFEGAIGKVAVYDHALLPTRIRAHFTAMNSRVPTGSCAETCSLQGPDPSLP